MAITTMKILKEVITLLLTHAVERANCNTDFAKVTAYWVKDIIRIDIKPYADTINGTSFVDTLRGDPDV